MYSAAPKSCQHCHLISTSCFAGCHTAAASCRGWTTALPPAMWRLRAFQAAGQAVTLVQALAGSGTPGAASRTSPRCCPHPPPAQPECFDKTLLLAPSHFKTKFCSRVHRPGPSPCRLVANCHPAVTGAAQVVPAERWDMEAYYAPDATSNLKMDVRLAAFAPSFDCFDATAFRWPQSLFLSAVLLRRLLPHLIARRR